VGAANKKNKARESPAIKIYFMDFDFHPTE
jgi:hypothetical protein